MPGPISDAELNSLRQLHDDLALPDTCEIVHVTTSTDDLGAETEVEDFAGVTVACRYVEEFSVREQQFVSRIDGAVSGVLTVPYDTDIRDSDHITNLTVGGVLMTTLIDDEEVPATYGVRALPKRTYQTKQTVYVGRL